MNSIRDNSLQGKFHRLRSNKAFELFVVGIIVFSALVIGAKTYDIPPILSQIIVITDWFITLFFLVEITIRFIGEPYKRNFFKSAWNIFDALIVIVSLVPIEDSEMALIGRLIRVFRVLRMVSIIPELRILISSLLKAMPQLGYVALLMFIIFYIYGAVGSFFFAPINDVLWGDIAVSMLTLFRVMTFEDWTDVMYETMEQYPLSWIFYVSFIFLTAFAFLNMIIGIVVNVIESENRARQLEEEGEQPNRADLEVQLQHLQASVDELLKRAGSSGEQR
ncbi:ion transporter [Gilvimarinus sp. SDUM040013]|uniref:Ion transporter n=1 Tax=Gilvimarinus gilvus TaxID=3058038 RepID=A0ABU4RYD7_9GAMM|nr:ion transporter [Gilvimarinus sp. SDUM040013]MDO3385591.1 ion transporter [Gilvimarinus sp. SDUM040013]MDX6849925.1 ion transporter [Gilvimarinus sp. SDUM040013]